MRPTVAEIRLGALVSNYEALQRRVERCAARDGSVLAVIKADAYGHGVERCGRALVELPSPGAPWLGVTSVEEALQLRAGLFAGRRGPGGVDPGASSLGPGPGAAVSEPWARAMATRVLVMSGFFSGEEEEVVRLGLRPQVWEPWHLEQLARAAARLRYEPGAVPVHLELDTGMSRQGVAPGEALAALLALPALAPGSPLRVEGVLTHFSSPEELEQPVMDGQIRRFRAGLEQLRAAGIRPEWVHAGNSANALAGNALASLAALAQPFGARLLVRPGLALYGVPTRFTPATPETTIAGEALKAVMQWRTEVTSLRVVEAGTAVGYNETFRAERRMRLALLPVGYADGLRRELSNRGAMLLRGRRVPVVGRVSMDQTVLDVSEVPEAEIGDPVVILGEQAAAKIDAWEHADWCGTIPYEVLCGVGRRVPRVEG